MPPNVMKKPIAKSLIKETKDDAGRSGKPERLFFFPEGRTYSPPAKQAVVSLPAVGLVRSSRTVHRTLLQRGQTMPPRFTSSPLSVHPAGDFRLICAICSDAANRCPYSEQHLPSGCESLRLPTFTLHTSRGGSLSQMQAVTKMFGLFSFVCAKRNKIAPCGAERK